MEFSLDKENTTILIADDEPTNRYIIKLALSQDGYKLIEAKNGEEAIQLAKKHTPDIILMDAMMPKMDGFEAIKKIKNDEELNKIPILMITALNSQEDKIKAFESGANDYLSKPFEPEELYLRIQKLLALFKNDAIDNKSFIFGDFVFNITTLQLKKNSKIVYLTEGENKLLLKLINKNNAIVLREELAESDYDESELRKVDVQVTRLRQKIEENPKQPRFIKTIRGKGYKLICNEI